MCVISIDFFFHYDIIKYVRAQFCGKLEMIRNTDRLGYPEGGPDMKIKDLYIYSNTKRTFRHADMEIENGRIVAIGDLMGHSEGFDYDGGGAYVVPGLIDVHTHGIGGEDWGYANAEGYKKMLSEYAKHGVTSVMPTISSAPYENMLGAAERINGFVNDDNRASVIGVHMEGRYLNPEKKGAHAPELIALPKADELDSPILKKCKRLHISAAYELDKDGDFAAKAKEIGATLGLAHTMADYYEAKTAESRGVTSYTHLFNAMPPLHHRNGGCIAAAFEGNCFAELICDGIHVSPEMVRLSYRALGRDRLVLVSDSLDATGLPDGEYFSSGLPVTVKDGICRIASGALAGSTITLDSAVRNLMNFCSIPLTEAILAATEAPARQMGVFDDIGSIEVGKRADMLLLKNGETLDIQHVMIGGNFIV